MQAKDIWIYFLAGLIVIAGAVGLYDNVAVSAGGLPEAKGSVSPLASLPPPFPGVTRLRLVLIGADDREGEGGRSDTLMILWLNPRTKRGALLSIPRDLRVEIPGHGRTKINHAYAYGGPKLTVETVQLLLGLPIDGYVKINFEGFVKAVDILGGVYVLVPDVEGEGRGMNYDDNWGNLHVHLKPGWQHLDGYQAMGFCRYRKSNYGHLGDGDYGRMERQQQFLRAIIEQKLRLSNLPNLLRAGSEIMKCIETTLSWRECVDLARLLKEFKTTDLKSFTAPVVDTLSGGIYYSELQTDAFARLLADIEDHLEGRDVAVRRIVLKDGTEQAGLAAKAAELLVQAGFAIVATRPATKPVATTKILYPTGQKDMAIAAALALGAGKLEELSEQSSEDAEAGAACLEIILGRDYHLPHSPLSSIRREEAGVSAQSH